MIYIKKKSFTRLFFQSSSALPIARFITVANNVITTTSDANKKFAKSVVFAANCQHSLSISLDFSLSLSLRFTFACFVNVALSSGVRLITSYKNNLFYTVGRLKSFYWILPHLNPGTQTVPIGTVGSFSAPVLIKYTRI